MTFSKGILAASLACGLILAGCGGDDTAENAGMQASTPDGTIMSGVRSLRNDDIGAFLETVMPRELMDEMRQGYTDAMSDPIAPQAAAEFEMQMAMLTSPDAEQTLMAMIEPQLAQMGQALPMIIAMSAAGANEQLESDPNLSPQEREVALGALAALGDWAQNADLTSVDKAREAISIATGTARDLDLQTLNQVRALSFDDALAKAGLAFGGAKAVLEVYDLSINDMLDSVEAKTVADRGDEADVQIAFNFLGTSQTLDSTMVRAGEGWFSKGFSEQGDAYQDFSVRSYVAEGLNMAAVAKLAVAEYYMTTGNYPADNYEAGYQSPSTEIVSDISIAGNTITITFASPPEIAGKTMYLTAEASDYSVTWACEDSQSFGRAGDMDLKYKPESCRP